MYKDSGDAGTVSGSARLRLSHVLFAAVIGILLANAGSPLDTTLDFVAAVRQLAQLAPLAAIPTAPALVLTSVAGLTAWTLVASRRRPRWWCRFSYRPRHHER